MLTGGALTLLVRGGDEDAVIGRDKESAVTGRPSPVVEMLPVNMSRRGRIQCGRGRGEVGRRSGGIGFLKENGVGSDGKSKNEGGGGSGRSKLKESPSRT